MQEGDIRRIRTDQFRFRLQGRLFRDPLIVLQMEMRIEVVKGYVSPRWVFKGSEWCDVTLQDLTNMSLQSLISPRDSDALPTCFKPRRKLFGWCLVLQVCDGAYQANKWRNARLQDLNIKDGRIQGGLGLVSR
jgi:hypothetical protein